MARFRLPAARDYGAPVGAGVVMAGLGVWGLDRPSMYSGEAATRWSATLPIPQLHHLLQHVDAVHGLYYSFMHIWLLAGQGVTMLRVPSVVGMTGAVVLTAVLGQRLTGSRRIGFIAAILTALTPLVDSYAQNARSYALLVGFVLGTGLALLRALEQPTVRRWVLYAFLVAFTGWLHELTLVTLGAHAAMLLLAGTPLRVARRWAISAVVGAAVVLPLVYVSKKQSGQVEWIRPTHLADVGVLFHDVFGVSTIVAVLVGLAALVGVLPGRLRGGWSQRAMSLPAFAAPLLIVPPALLMIESVLGQPLYDPRYVIYCVPAGALLAARGLERVGTAVGRFRRGWGRVLVWALPIAVCVVSLVAQFPQQQRLRTADGRPQDYRSAAVYVQNHKRRGDGLIFIKNNFRNAQLGYPRQFAHLDDFTLRKSPRASGTFRGKFKPWSQTARAALHLRRIWVVGLTSARYSGRAKFELAFLARSFHRTHFAHFHGINVALYERAATLRA